MSYFNEESAFAAAVGVELQKARGKYTELVPVGSRPEWEVLDAQSPVGMEIVRLPGHKPFGSATEGYAAILEELEVFWAEVTKNYENRDREIMLSKLVQIAAMAQRTAEDLELI